MNGPPGTALALSAGSEVKVTSRESGLIHATRRAAAVVGIDSGPMHLAAALGKPGVAIFGPTDPERNGPYGGSFTVLRSPGAVTSYKRQREPGRSMREISPDAVFERSRAAWPREARPRSAPRFDPPVLVSQTLCRLVARMRVPFGFVLVAAFAWLSAPDARSLAWGLPIAKPDSCCAAGRPDTSRRTSGWRWAAPMRT